MTALPLGKLPPDLLRRLLTRRPPNGPRVLLGPGMGLDCAVVDFGETLLIAKSDPITLATTSIGRYAVHINANDVATTGARPRWFLATILLPEGRSDETGVEALWEEVTATCRSIDVELIGGHTEVTQGLERPILAGTMLGEVEPDRLITPRGARPGDALLLTKGIPLEAACVLARDYSHLLPAIDPQILERARRYLEDPGISVLPEAAAAASTGAVTAMHDLTEAGLAGGLSELAEAAGVALIVDAESIPLLEEASIICAAAQINPLTALASGSLLLTVKEDHEEPVVRAIQAAGRKVARIGEVVDGRGVAMRKDGKEGELPRPERDALAVWLESRSI